MQIRVPEYYEKFKCIADRCKDSCCIGWEIDVDAVAEEKYRALDTELGREIVEKTKQGFFPLEENGRCAFLDRKGLCRIISSVGEGYLCDICREHPRYYGISADGLEGGLGLGCEEAARMILECGGEVKFTYIEHEPSYHSEDEFAYFTDGVREAIYGKICECDVTELLGYMLDLAPAVDGAAFDVCAGLKTDDIEITPRDVDEERLSEEFSAFGNLVEECEALSEGWEKSVVLARDVPLDEILTKEKEIKSLIFYFTHRYVRECAEDMTAGQRVLFSLFSSLFTVALASGKGDDEAMIRAAVDFSKNIEYSTDNVDMILDGLSNFL